MVTEVTLDLASTFCLAPLLLGLELQERSQIIAGVVGHHNKARTMLRRSAQVLLAFENEHF